MNRTLLGVEGRLKTLAAARGLDREWVDGHFPAPDTVKRARAGRPGAPANAG